MKAISRPASVAALFLPLMLSGCSLLPTTRKLPIPKAPMVTQTVAPEELVAQLNQRWNALDSLNVTVEMQASVIKSKEGLAKDYTTIRGIILMRKPEMLRVYGRVPVIGTRAFDMVSDGTNFTLYIPSKNKVIKGSNSLKKKSSNQLENMRPGFFFDAMVVRGMEKDDLYSVTAETITVEDAAKKHLYSVPEYILSIMRYKPYSQELEPVRVVRFHRDDLEPYQQDIYDKEGNLETQVSYADYRNFDSGLYPTMITIKRPLEEYQIVLTVDLTADNVKKNQQLTDDQFVVKIPEGTVTQNLE
jgi:outer membrane lipoprotein-sorting protein